MKTPNRIFKIAVLEDSDFYNQIMTTRLYNFTNELAFYLKFDFRIETFLQSDDFLENLKTDTDIALVDFYLDDGVTGDKILKKIKEKCSDCKVAIISQSGKAGLIVRQIARDDTKFIYKDQYAIPRICFFVEDVANSRFGEKMVN